MKQSKKRERMLSFLLRLNPEIRKAIVAKLRLFALLVIIWGQGL